MLIVQITQWMANILISYWWCKFGNIKISLVVFQIVCGIQNVFYVRHNVYIIYHLCFLQITKSAMLLCHISRQDLNVTSTNNVSKRYLGSASVSRFFIFLSCWKWKLMSVARTISITRVRNSRNSSLERFWRMLHSSSLITLWTQKQMTMLYLPLIK